MLDVAVTSVLSFISTNVDDIFILMLLFGQAGKRIENIKITIGQYLGISVLVCLSMVGTLVTKTIPEEYIRFLGLVPIALGIKACWDSRKEVCKRQEGHCNSTEISVNSMLGITSVMALVISNGADNIGIYIPVFSRFGMMDILMLFAIFAVMTGVWCVIGYRLASLPVIKNIIHKYQYVLVPLVLIGLGIYILVG